MHDDRTSGRSVDAAQPALVTERHRSRGRGGRGRGSRAPPSALDSVDRWSHDHFNVPDSPAAPLAAAFQRRERDDWAPRDAPSRGGRTTYYVPPAKNDIAEARDERHAPRGRGRGEHRGGLTRAEVDRLSTPLDQSAPAQPPQSAAPAAPVSAATGSRPHAASIETQTEPAPQKPSIAVRAPRNRARALTTVAGGQRCSSGCCLTSHLVRILHVTIFRRRARVAASDTRRSARSAPPRLTTPRLPVRARPPAATVH